MLLEGWDMNCYRGALLLGLCKARSGAKPVPTSSIPARSARLS